MYCPKCGVKNSSNSRFCRSCGNRFQEAAAARAQEVKGPRPWQEGAPPASARPPAPRPPSAPRPAPALQLNPQTMPLLIVALILLIISVASVFYALQQSQLASGAGAASEAMAGQAAIKPDGGDADGHAAAAAGGDKADKGTSGDSAEAGGVKPAPVPAEDPVAQATVVLERYLAADLGHDGKEMAKYLGGQAAARFNPEVQGQEDLTVHSKKISGHTVSDDNTMVFKVATRWSPSDSSEVKTDVQQYLLKRTEKGWRIFATPEYPES